MSLTKRQIDALEGAFTSGNAFHIIQGIRSNGGGSIRRMIEGLADQGYLRKRHWGLTAKGATQLRDYWAARNRGVIYAERLRQIETLVPQLEAEEAEAARAADAEKAERRRQGEERVARHRKRRIATFRAFAEELSDQGGHANQFRIGIELAAMSDDDLLALIDRIVDKDQAA